MLTVTLSSKSAMHAWVCNVQKVFPFSLWKKRKNKSIRNKLSELIAVVKIGTINKMLHASFEMDACVLWGWNAIWERNKIDGYCIFPFKSVHWKSNISMANCSLTNSHHIYLSLIPLSINEINVVNILWHFLEIWMEPQRTTIEWSSR